MLDILSNFNNPHYAENRALNQLSDIMNKQNKSLEEMLEKKQ